MAILIMMFEIPKPLLLFFPLKPQIFIQNNKKINAFLPDCHQSEILICSNKEAQYISDSAGIVSGFEEIYMVNVILDPWQII